MSEKNSYPFISVIRSYISRYASDNSNQLIEHFIIICKYKHYFLLITLAVNCSWAFASVTETKFNLLSVIFELMFGHIVSSGAA